MPLLFLALFLTLAAHSAETSLSRYARSEPGVLAKEYDMEGGRAYWINGISILGLPDAGADIMGFSEPAKRLPLGFSGIYTPPPVYERYGLSLNASTGNLIFKENYNPIDTPITMLLWERYGLDGNAFRLNFNRQLLDSIVFSLGLASHSVASSGDFYYTDVVHQLYTGTLGRDSSGVPLAGRSLMYNSFHFVPAVSWIFPNSSLTAQMSFWSLDNDDATRDFFEREDPTASIYFTQPPYSIKGDMSFYRALWNYKISPKWELSLSHRYASQEFKFSKLDTGSIENYTAQTGEGRISHRTFLNPYVNVRYEYLRGKQEDLRLYQDRQLLLLGIRDSLWRFAFRGESGLQRNASALDSVAHAPALHLGFTVFLPWHLQLSGDYQKDTRFPDMHETHISRAGRVAFPNRNLKAEKRQRFETAIKYRLSEHFFYAAGFRYEQLQNAIMPYWAVPKTRMLDSLPADSAFRWANARAIENNELFWRLGFELGNWRFYAEQGKTILRTFMPSIPSRYYKGAVYWSNRFVEDRLKVSAQFDADWFGSRWDYGIENDSIARPVYLKSYLSLNFKSAMQIQDFTLYARIENMNHSLMEPEAGYAPPGIRFAYGIEWMLGD
jgi:outer membrane receptor protein involved in Fe transport